MCHWVPVLIPLHFICNAHDKSHGTPCEWHLWKWRPQIFLFKGTHTLILSFCVCSTGLWAVSLQAVRGSRGHLLWVSRGISGIVNAWSMKWDNWEMTRLLSVQVVEKDKNMARICVPDRAWTGWGWRGCWMSTGFLVEFSCLVNCGAHTLSSVFNYYTQKIYPFYFFFSDLCWRSSIAFSRTYTHCCCNIRSDRGIRFYSISIPTA